ncbi:hypothetical protein PVL29_018763 [Vitis rotundifolia]|uniref:Uncharacterized protein n=1 Tax=Vitis rotundifolia TaxID=103349 RepID=A0AA39DGM5_VITRO|nr:hypothetical protein PVL29_018763 [Vitis rotundifolia]
MLLYKQKKNQSVGKDNRLLIGINVLGSVGLIRFIVNKDELVATGRLPILGSNLNNFLLYCSNTIGSNGSRNFMQCKRPQLQKTIEVGVERRAGMPR